MPPPRPAERVVAHVVFAACVAMAALDPPAGASRALLTVLAIGAWWFARRGRASRLVAIGIFVAGWLQGAPVGWMALILAVILRRAIARPVAPAVSPREPAGQGPAPKTVRSREQILAEWPPKARDVVEAARTAHGDGDVAVVLNDPRLYVRRYAIREFGRTRDTRAVDALLGLLSDEDYLTRRYAPIALAQIGTEEARAGLLEAFRRAWTAQTRLDDSTNPIETSEEGSALTSEARGLREIAESLVILGPAAIEPLMAAARGGSEEVVTWSSVPLGALGAVDAVPLMLERLTEDNNSMKGQVREAIRRIGPRAMPALADRRQDGTSVARAVAVDLIRSFQGIPPPTAEGLPDPPGRA